MIKIYTTVGLLFFYFAGFCQLSGIDSIKQLQRDEIDFIIKSLRENSIDTLRGLTKEEWHEGIKEIYKKVDEAKTKKEYYFALRYFGALINDGHCAFPRDGIYNATGILKKTDTIFPVWVKSWRDGRVFTVKDFSGKIPKYSEIISVNGISAREIALKQRKIIPLENHYAFAHTSQVTEGDPAYWTTFSNYLFCEGIKYPYTVEYKTDNLLHKIVLTGMEREKIYEIYRQDEGKEVVKQESIGYILFKRGKNTIRYNQINDTIGVLKIELFLGINIVKMLISGGDKGFPNILSSCMKKINNDGIKHLIIDLRDNIGGYEYNVYELLACFTDKKFTVSNVNLVTDKSRKLMAKVLKKSYKTIYGKKNPDVKRSLEILQSMPSGSLFRADTILSMQYTPQYKGEKFTGQTYLLTNVVCYSASILFSDIFQSEKLGLLAGESPGGYTTVTFGSIYPISLPYSKYMSIDISNSHSSNKLKHDYEYLTPDIPIEPTLEEWLYEKYDSLEQLITMVKEGNIKENR
jgi:C-terminal processing protease CtpA/Prc